MEKKRLNLVLEKLSGQKKDYTLLGKSFLRYNVDFKKVVEFVLKRRNEKGGFGLAPTVPPSIQDTYYALSILHELNKISKRYFSYIPSEDKKLYKYLKYISLKNDTTPKLIYYYIRSCKIAQVMFDIQIITMLLKNKFHTMEQQFYIKKISKQISEINLKINVNKWHTIKELMMYIYLNQNITEKEKYSIYIWLDRCKNPDGGFGFLPATTSFIENTYYGISALMYLKKNLNEVERQKIINFILSCYTGRGGFARKNGGSPLLESTYYAVKSLSLINNF